MITVSNIEDIEPNAFNGLDKYTFQTHEYDQPVYAFRKPGNEIRANDILDGTVAPDKRGVMKFTPTKTGQFAASPQAAPQPAGSPDLLNATKELTNAIQELTRVLNDPNKLTDMDIKTAQSILGGEVVNDL